MVDGNQDSKISFNIRKKTLELFQTRVCNISKLWQKNNFIFLIFQIKKKDFLVVIFIYFLLKSIWFLTKRFIKRYIEGLRQD